MTTKVKTASGHTINYAPPCWACGHDRNPVVTDECCNKDCLAANPHEMPGEQLDRADLDIATALRIINRVKELNSPWLARILMRELSDDLPERVPGEMTDERIAHVAGLRQLADILEANPQIKTPFQYIGGVNFYTWEGDDPKEEMRNWRRAAGGTWNKEWEDGAYGDFILKRTFGDIEVRLKTPRENVCERVVVETVTETVMEYPAEAFAGIEKVAVEREKEIVEWVCPDTI